MNRLQSLLRETFRQGDTHHVPKVGAELCFTPASRSLYEPFLVLLLLSMLVEGTAAKA